MSLDLTKEVWARAPHRGERLLVLLALADWAQADGFCYPSQRQVAEKARISQKAAKDILHDLIAEGMLEVLESGNGRGHPTHYRLRLETGQTPSPERGVSETPLLQNGVSDLRKGGFSTPERGYPDVRAYKELTVMRRSDKKTVKRARARAEKSSGGKVGREPERDRELTPEEIRRTISELEGEGLGQEPYTETLRAHLAAHASDKGAA
jgi:DNA-binding transcriptional regulator YhcF (GntR family)